MTLRELLAAARETGLGLDAEVMVFVRQKDMGTAPFGAALLSLAPDSDPMLAVCSNGKALQLTTEPWEE